MCWLGPCWLWIDGGTNLQLHENVVNAEMDQEKKNPRVGQWTSTF